MTTLEQDGITLKNFMRYQLNLLGIQYESSDKLTKLANRLLDEQYITDNNIDIITASISKTIVDNSYNDYVDIIFVNNSQSPCTFIVENTELNYVFTLCNINETTEETIINSGSDIVFTRRLYINENVLSYFTDRIELEIAQYDGENSTIINTFTIRINNSTIVDDIIQFKNIFINNIRAINRHAISNNMGLTTLANKITEIFYDECNADNVNNYYGNSILIRSGSNNQNSSNTLTYDETNEEYYFVGSGYYFSGREIIMLRGIDDAKVRIKFKMHNFHYPHNQLLILCSDNDTTSATSQEYCCRVQSNGKLSYFDMQNEEVIYTENTDFTTEWFYLEAKKRGTSWTMTLYDNNLTQLATQTKTLTEMTNSPKWYIGLQTELGTACPVHIKEIIGQLL